MKDQQKERQQPVNSTTADKDKCQRKKERRKKECEGYCYIEMVGWIDRREKLRRDDDCFLD